MLGCIFLLNIWIFVVSGYKILVYSPTLGKSHVALLGKISDVLVQAGHDVVNIISLLLLLVSTQSKD